MPDKYRFLLFEDKREVELVWDGKSNEVCNVVLRFQVIEQVDEPRAETAKEQPTLFNMDERGRQLNENDIVADFFCGSGTTATGDARTVDEGMDQLD